MNISATTASSGGASATNNSGDQTVRELEKKIDDLYKKITQENASKDDAKTKEAKIKVYEDQIQEIDAEISRKEMQQNQSRKAGQKTVTSQDGQNKRTTNDGYDASSIVEYLRRNTANELFDTQG